MGRATGHASGPGYQSLEILGSLGAKKLQQLIADLLVRGRQIHGGEAHPMPLDPHRFIHRSADGGMEQQAIGMIRPGIAATLLRAR